MGQAPAPRRASGPPASWAPRLRATHARRPQCRGQRGPRGPAGTSGDPVPPLRPRTAPSSRVSGRQRSPWVRAPHASGTSSDLSDPVKSLSADVVPSRGPGGWDLALPIWGGGATAGTPAGLSRGHRCDETLTPSGPGSRAGLRATPTPRPQGRGGSPMRTLSPSSARASGGPGAHVRASRKAEGLCSALEELGA